MEDGIPSQYAFTTFSVAAAIWLQPRPLQPPPPAVMHDLLDSSPSNAHCGRLLCCVFPTCKITSRFFHLKNDTVTPSTTTHTLLHVPQGALLCPLTHTSLGFLGTHWHSVCVCVWVCVGVAVGHAWHRGTGSSEWGSFRFDSLVDLASFWRPCGCPGCLALQCAQGENKARGERESASTEAMNANAAWHEHSVTIPD